MKIVFALLAVLLLGGCDAVAVAGTMTPPAPEATSSSPLRFAVAGDSLTTANNLSFPTPTGEFVDGTWLHWVLEQPHVELAGGYAYPGAMSGDIARNIGPVDADVLVVMAGTNDLGVTPVPEVLDNVESIAATAGTDRVVVCAIPPRDNLVDASSELNAALRTLAANRGWTFVDPWSKARSSTGSWSVGMAIDGVHPIPSAAHAAGVIIGAAIRAVTY